MGAGLSSHLGRSRGAAAARQRQPPAGEQAVPPALCQPPGPLPREIDRGKLRKLVRSRRLAPCHPGCFEPAEDDGDAAGAADHPAVAALHLTTDACPVCFLRFPALNVATCCRQLLCTSCFVMVCMTGWCLERAFASRSITHGASSQKPAFRSSHPAPPSSTPHPAAKHNQAPRQGGVPFLPRGAVDRQGEWGPGPPPGLGIGIMRRTFEVSPANGPRNTQIHPLQFPGARTAAEREVEWREHQDAEAARLGRLREAVAAVATAAVAQAAAQAAVAAGRVD
jgi:hypothetical protein